MPRDTGYSFPEYRRDRDRKEIDKSFEAFEDDLTREEFGAATRAFQAEIPGPMNAAAASTEFSNQKRKAAKAHSERSKRARASDNSQLATLTTDFRTWESDPADYDFPGVDTPTDTGLSGLLNR